MVINGAAEEASEASPPQAEAAGETFWLFLPDPSAHLPGGCCVTLCKIALEHICQQRSPMSFSALVSH